MQIVVLDGHALNPGDNPWDLVAELGEVQVYDRTPQGKIIERSADADIIVTNKVSFMRETLDQLPKLKFIAVTATGYNNVDLVATRERGIPVSNVPEYSTDSVAEFAFGLILALAHRIEHHSERVHKGAWSAQPHFTFWDTVQVELSGKTLVIIGHGHIGKKVGEIANVFGMNVIPIGRDHGNLGEAIGKADIVTLHAPLTPETSGIVNKEFLSRMKPSAYLINAARGGLVVEQDLADALNNGAIAGAAVDVVSFEPIKPENPLLKAKNCIITPHIAWATLEARKRLMQTTAENIRAFLAGKPINVVNL